MRWVFRAAAAVVVSALMWALLGAAGLWGVAFAAPALLLAPSAVRDAVRERAARRDLDAELRLFFAGTSEHR